MLRGPVPALLIVLGSLACGRDPPACGGLSREDLAAIGDLQQTWIQAIKDGDWARAAAVHAEDAVRLPPDGNDERGRAAIHASIAQMQPPSEVSAKFVEIDGCGDLAYAWNSFSVTFPPAGPQKPPPYTGRDLVIFRKQRDGQWLVSRVIWNSDQQASR